MVKVAGSDLVECNGPALCEAWRSPFGSRRNVWRIASLQVGRSVQSGAGSSRSPHARRLLIKRLHHAMKVVVCLATRLNAHEVHGVAKGKARED